MRRVDPHNGGVLTVRVLPRDGVTLRAAAATVEVTGALAVGHVWAGGSLPSVPWLAVMATAVFGSGLLVLRGRVSPLLAVPALVVVQLLLHAWLTTLTATPTMEMGAATHSGSTHALLHPSMLAVHVAGGLLTALLWELRTRAAEVVVTATPQPLPPLPGVRRVPATVLAPRPKVGRSVVAAAPRRGPPRALLVA